MTRAFNSDKVIRHVKVCLLERETFDDRFLESGQFEDLCDRLDGRTRAFR
jgi:hypothetical protein